MQSSLTAPLVPPLKWAGGKRQLLPKILPRIPANPTLYVEPFAGGAAVLLALHPSRAILNDANPELISVYRVIRDDPFSLLDILREHAAKDCADYFYEIRSQDRTSSFHSLSPTVRAARTIYLNKTCYNGLYRVNRKGQFNSPYGHYRHPKIVDEQNVLSLSAYLRDHVEITNEDYATILQSLSKSAFVYLDPPYIPLTQTASFTAYTKDGFTYEDQQALRDNCSYLRTQSIQFLESNSDTPTTRDLYQDFKIETVTANRQIASKAKSRSKVSELLIHA